MGQVIHTLLLPRDGTKDVLYKINEDFVYLILALAVLIESNEECSRANLRISLGLSERGSFDYIRTSVVRLAYPKSGMFFMHWIYRHCCRLQIQVYNLLFKNKKMN